MILRAGILSLMLSSLSAQAATCSDPAKYWDKVKNEFMPLYGNAVRALSTQEWQDNSCERTSIMAAALYLVKEAERTNCGVDQYEVDQNLANVKVVQEDFEYQVDIHPLKPDGLEVRRFVTVLTSDGPGRNCEIAKIGD